MNKPSLLYAGSNFPPPEEQVFLLAKVTTGTTLFFLPVRLKKLRSFFLVFFSTNK